MNVIVGVIAVAAGADGLNRLRRQLARGELEASPRTLLFAALLVALAAVGSLYAARGFQGSPVPTWLQAGLFTLVLAVAVGNYVVGRS